MSEHHKGKEYRKRRGQSKLLKRTCSCETFTVCLDWNKKPTNHKVPETECNGFFTEESWNVRYPSVCFQKPGTSGPSRDMDTV